MEIRGIRIDEHFQKSINLKYDIQNTDKIVNYIPATSTVNLIGQYIDDFTDSESHASTMLVGPYGKGKSQTILTLLGLISNYDENINQLVTKISKTSQSVSDKIKQYRKNNKKYLPIIVSNTQNNFNQAILIALMEALKRDGLESIKPKTNYSAALTKIKQWKNEFPGTYDLFLNNVDNIKKFEKGLQNFDENIYAEFCMIHRKLTAGTEFNPLINMEITAVLDSIALELKRTYKYEGLVLIFDEFTKYLESSNEDTITNELKIIQDVCELSNTSKEYRIFSIFIMHKRISEYNYMLDDKIKNTFKGIEGRIEYRKIETTAKNNYELITHVLQKNNYDFLKDDNKEIEELRDTSVNYISGITSVFTKEEIEDIMIKGCYPLTPISAMSLLRLSEKFAQNERSLFTFLASRENNSLINILLNNPTNRYITLDQIYDYFETLIEKDVEEIYAHNIYLKLKYALNKNHGENKKILKALAVILMINDFDNMKPDCYVLSNALAINPKEAKGIIKELIDKDIIQDRKGILVFKSENVLNYEKDIKNIIDTKYSNISIAVEMNELLQEKYLVSHRYNNKYKMTRFFEKIFMTVDQFNALPNVKTLYEECFSDGKIIYLLPDKTLEINKQIQSDDRSLIILPKLDVDFSKVIKKIKAINYLLDKKSDKSEIIELTNMKIDYIDELEELINKTYNSNEVLNIIFNNEEMTNINSSQLDEILCYMLEKYYDKTPIINYELINKTTLSGAYRKAREILIDRVLNNDYDDLHHGTSAESSIYRTVLSNNGLADNENQLELNDKVQNVLNEIRDHLINNRNQKKTFEELYEILMGKGYGLRKGLIPIYLAYQLSHMDIDLTLYYRNKEIDVSAKYFDILNDHPIDVAFRIEEKSASREKYLANLEEMFIDYSSSINNRYSRTKRIFQSIQVWYNSLPKIAKIVDLYDDRRLNKNVKKMMLIVSKIDSNASDFILDDLPTIFGEDYDSIINQVSKIKNDLDVVVDDLKTNVEKIVKEELNIAMESNLKVGIVHWFEPYREKAKIASLSSIASSLVNCFDGMELISEHMLVNSIAMCICGNYVEDWNVNTKDEFLIKLKEAIKNIENCNTQEGMGDSKLVITMNNQSIVEKTYNDTDNPLSECLLSEMQELVDQYGDSLELEDKLSVLTKLIKDIIRN